MQRETKANLIFIAVLLAVMLPGVVKLVHKRTTSYARPMSMPPAVRQAAAYNDPNLQPPGLTRLVPEQTDAWTKALAGTAIQQAIGITPYQTIAPVMSSEYVFQLLAAKHDDNASALVALVWQPQVWTGSARFELLLMNDDGDTVVGVTTTQVQTLPVPRAIRRELQELGFVNPPHQVVLVSLRSEVPVRGVMELVLTSDPAVHPPAARAVLKLPVP